MYRGDQNLNSFLHYVIFQHYSYIQSPEIRAKVDELFNCEDIFLNALVADLTMRPGIHTYLTRLTMFPLCER